MNQAKYNVFLFYKAFVIISLWKKSIPGWEFRVHTHFQSYFLAVGEYCNRVERVSGVFEKQAADSCVFLRPGWESQLWSADLQHKQERLCKFDLPSINPLWIFPITGRIIGKPHPHIPVPLCSDEPYKDWLWPSHKLHQAASIDCKLTCNVPMVFPGYMTGIRVEFIVSKAKKQTLQWLIVLIRTF